MCRKIRYLIKCFHAEFGFSYAVKHSRADLGFLLFRLVVTGNVREKMLCSPKGRFLLIMHLTYIRSIEA